MIRGEQWRDIPGLGGWYQASNFGQIRTWHSRSGRGRSKVPYIMKVHGRGIVSLRPVDLDRPKIYGVSYLVYITWVGPIPLGKRVIHRSLDSHDNRPENLILGTMKTQARRMNAIKPGAHNRKPVVKMDTDLSCNLKRTSVIAGDGYIYAWDDDAWMRRTLKRAMAELEAKGIRSTDPCTEEYYNLPPALTDGLDLDAIPWAETAPCGDSENVR